MENSGSAIEQMHTMSEAFEQRSRSLEGRLDALSREAQGDRDAELREQIALLTERLDQAERQASLSRGGAGECDLDAMLEPFCEPIERRLHELELSSSAAAADVRAKLASLEEDDVETGRHLLAEAAAVRSELARLAADVKRLQERPAEAASAMPNRAVSATSTAPTTRAPTKKLDPKDFMFSQRQSESLVRTQGQIGGQQFILEELSDCEVLLLDHSAQVCPTLGQGAARSSIPKTSVSHSARRAVRVCALALWCVAMPAPIGSTRGLAVAR
jgi:hypothetical protein